MLLRYEALTCLAPQRVNSLTLRGDVLGGVVARKVVGGGPENTQSRRPIYHFQLQVNQEDLGAAPKRLRWLH